MENENTNTTTGKFDTPLPENPYIFPEARVETIEALTGLAEDQTLALSGLRRAVVEKRLGRAEKKIEKLEKSASVHQEASLSVLERRVPSSDIRPITVSQRRQSLRSKRRLEKNMRQAIINYGIKSVYGEGVGEDSPSDKTARLTRKESRMIKHAKRTYKHNQRVVDRRVGRVIRSSEGRDMPGHTISKRVESVRARRDRLQKKLDGEPYEPTKTEKAIKATRRGAVKAALLTGRGTKAVARTGYKGARAVARETWRSGEQYTRRLIEANRSSEGVLGAEDMPEVNDFKSRFRKARTKRGRKYQLRQARNRRGVV